MRLERDGPRAMVELGGPMERGSLMDDGFATGSLLDRLQLPPDRDDDEPAPWLADPTYAVDGFREGLDQGTSIAA